MAHLLEHMNFIETTGGRQIKNEIEPTRSLRGLLAKYGPAPSAEEIDENRAENFPSSDFS